MACRVCYYKNLKINPLCGQVMQLFGRIVMHRHLLFASLRCCFIGTYLYIMIRFFLLAIKLFAIRSDLFRQRPSLCFMIRFALLLKTVFHYDIICPESCQTCPQSEIILSFCNDTLGTPLISRVKRNEKRPKALAPLDKFPRISSRMKGIHQVEQKREIPRAK